MPPTIARLRRLVFLFTVIVLAIASSGYAQPKIETPPGVDYPRDNVVSGYRVEANGRRVSRLIRGRRCRASRSMRKGSSGQSTAARCRYRSTQRWKTRQAMGKGYFVSPHQIRFGREGHVWIADSHAHVIYKFTRGGDKLLTIGIPNEPGDDNKHLKMPTDMVEAPSGEVFISDGYRNNRVVVCNSKGEFIRTWGELGTKPGQLSLPHSIARDSKGRIYVADRNNSRVQVFTEAGKFVEQWANLCQPWTVRITADDEVYICGASPSRWREEDVQLGIPPKDQIVMKFDTTGRVLTWWRFPQGPDEADMGVKSESYLGSTAWRLTPKATCTSATSWANAPNASCS